MSQIFFSYSRKDSEFVDQLIERLEAYGVDIWVDRGEILAGEAWRRTIVEAIMASQVFVIVLSPNSIELENVTKELTLAEQYDKRVLPVVIQEVKVPPSLEYQLAGLHYQTFTEGNYDDNFARLIRSLVSSGIKIQTIPEAEPEIIDAVIGPALDPEISAGTLNAKPEMDLAAFEPDPPLAKAALPSEPDPETLIAAAAFVPDTQLEAPATSVDPDPVVQSNAQVTPAPASRGETPLSSASTQTRGRFQAVPIWVWAVGGLLVIVGVIAGMSAIMGGGDQKIDPTATNAIAQIIPTEWTEPTLATNAPETIPTFTPIPAQITDGFGASMVFVPAGPFLLGAENEDPDEAPVREIWLDAFYIDQFEVSNQNYKECVRAGACSEPSKFESDTLFSYYDDDAFRNYPVIFVSWEDANAYCQWRGVRLPTEGEWEKAARGTDGWRYPWGNQFDPTRANYCGGSIYCPNEPDDGHKDTAPVDNFSAGASPFGVFQMAGNVNEWVADWYGEDYLSSLSDGDENPQGPSSGTERVIRGGSFGLNAGKLRVSNRGHASPLASGAYDGFRCAVGLR